LLIAFDKINAQSKLSNAQIAIIISDFMGNVSGFDFILMAAYHRVYAILISKNLILAENFIDIDKNIDTNVAAR
jgi:hypothetical protein